MPHDAVDFIVSAVMAGPDIVSQLCVHTYGCRVIQRILENCHERQTRLILDSILSHIHILIKDQFGNYVIQHILEQGKSPEDKNRIVKSIKGKVIDLSNHKFASNVVEKCLEFGSEKDRKDIIDEFLESHNYDLSEEIMTLGGPQMNGALYTMMKDRYGNYVIQKCIEVSKGKQREVLVKKITACANVLRKQANYSRHVYNFIEKMSSEGGGGASLGLGIVPTGGAPYQSSQGESGYGNYAGREQYGEGYQNYDNQQQQHHYVQKRQGNASGNQSNKNKRQV